jgi:hypothetical protein
MAGILVPTPTPGMTLLSTTTLTGNATVTLSSIPQTYKNLQLVIRDFFPSTSGSVSLQLNGDSGSTYSFVSVNANSASLSRNTGTSSIVLNDANLDARTNDRDSRAVCNFYDYTTALDHIYDIRFVYNNTSDTVIPVNLAGTYYPSTPAAITSFRIFTNGSGNINGTALLYGVN